MFCSECGARASGKFCSSCGHNLSAGATHPAAVVLAIDWRQCFDYETLLGLAEVRDRIARAAAQAKKSMTGEQFLDMYGNALGKLAGLPVALPMSSLAQFAQGTYAKLGVKTGKSRSEQLPQPVGTIMVSILCALARAGRVLRGAQQLSDGCILVAALPSDILALEGDLIITVRRASGGAHVEARTEIKGQLFDWGKSTRCLDALFTELTSSVAA